jgi:sporadic carbohydrate cluster 2OG-Fe(II) oxygenase
MIDQILPYYDWTLDPRWDNKILNYDRQKHNWAEWFFESVRELKPSLPRLEEVHYYFSTEELVGLRKHLEKLTNSLEFSRRLDEFFAEYVAPLVDDPDYLIQSTCGIRVVVPNQEKMGRLLSFHTGYWTGYNNFMGTVWTPLTRAWGSNTMQVLSWEDTIELMERIHNEKLPLDKIQSLCVAKMYPVELEVGQSWLFNQGHLHGNVNNDTDITRISFDARYALPRHNLGPRRAGSFYRLQGHHATVDLQDLKSGPWVVFVDQNSRYIGETPHYMIREFLLGVAKKLNITVNEWSNEYWGCTWMPKFLDFVSRDYLSGLVVPSIHAFSGNIESRIKMFQMALENGQQILFVDENLLLNDQTGIDLIRKIYALER